MNYKTTVSRTLLFSLLLSGTTHLGATMVTQVGSQNFEELAKAEKPFVLDVWAQWCEPCKKMKPIFEEVAKNTDAYLFGSLDFQQDQALAEKLKVRSLPTFIVFKGNKEYGRICGALAANAQELLGKINECLANENPVDIGSDVALTLPEIMTKLNMLMLLPTKEAQVQELKELFKLGMTPDMVLVDVPAMAGRPAMKLTPISLMLNGSVELLEVFLDNGADVVQINAEINAKLDLYNKEIEKMNQFKKVLQSR